MIARAASIVVLVLGLAQSTRDSAPLPKTGTANISGVVQDDQGVPLAGVQIAVFNQGRLLLRVTHTDASGRYFLDLMPAATYTIHASFAGFTPATFGSGRLIGPPVPIVLATGERFEANLTLTRISVVSGTIRDEYGAPTVALVTFLTRRPDFSRNSPLIPVKDVESDRHGRYRVEGLPAGNYLVRAHRPNTLPDVRQIEAGRERTVTYLPVYYPGVSSSTAARPIAIEPGADRAGIDLQLQLVPTTAFEGTIVDGSGNPLQSVTTRLIGDDEGAERYGSATADGRFRFVGVPTGRYVLAARGLLSGSSGEKRQVLWGSQEIFVSPETRVEPSLTFHPGADLAGHVVFDGSAAIPEFRRLPMGLVQMVPVAGVFSRFNLPNLVIGSDDPAAVAPPFKTIIRFDSVPPGRFLIVAPLPLPGGWSLRSAVINGVDVAAIPFEINPGQQVNDLVVTFTDRTTTLSGTIKNEIGEPVFAHMLVVFPVDSRARFDGIGSRIAAVRPDSTGKFTVRSLPAGDYLVALARDLNPAAMLLEEVLNSLETGAVRVRLVEGQETVQNLQTRDR
jgi:hypothetical protein